MCTARRAERKQIRPAVRHDNNVWYCHQKAPRSLQRAGLSDITTNIVCVVKAKEQMKPGRGTEQPASGITVSEKEM